MLNIIYLKHEHKSRNDILNKKSLSNISTFGVFTF